MPTLAYNKMMQGKPAFGVSAEEPSHNAMGIEGLVVAIPAYNEEVAIGSIVLGARKYAEKVVVIDDGSKDRTAEIAMLAGAEVITHPVNMGKGKGIKDAFRYARDNNAEILVLIDGDGQHDPGEIPSLIEPILSGEADVVNGSRFIVPNGNHVPAYRRVGQEVLTMVTNVGCRRKLTDSQNGYRAFARNAFTCFSFEHTGMAIESEMLIDASYADLRIKEVQIDVRYDVAGSTYNPVFHGLSVLTTTARIIAKRRPLLIFGSSGIVLLALGVIGIFLEVNALEFSRSIAIIYATAGMSCITLGTLCLFSALILTYIGDLKEILLQHT